ncbi:EAL domain-containing protein [Paenibacillus piri]|uniref:GGDEF and EAL domain-containing protein n=1 Tax=Paenibacillus piri TaxID=2547395 RepID=A0A4R5KWC6_9BACL|nr:EAL domain-containing protein [Paenibacillus piri]TDG00097.1 GGDEF and EAL domain-containing protein [Paenibacillus piri]
MEHIHGSFDAIAVGCSYAIAVLASYTALDLAGKVSLSKGTGRWLWLLFGAVAMGTGIWSMHFVGMLAFTLPVPVAYDFMIVLISVVTAIAASFIALYVVGRNELTLRQLLVGGMLLAAGIASMHYIGMAAMLIEITYDPLLFTLSIATAIGASIAALWLSFYFRKGGGKGGALKKLASGLVMGAAIAGMHYTGMGAAQFRPEAKPPLSVSMTLDHRLLPYFISAGVLCTLGLFLLAVFISRRFALKDTEMLENEKWYKSLYEHNQDGIISVDLRRQVTGFNRAASNMTGVDAARFYHQPVSAILSLIVEQERERTQKRFMKAFGGERQSFETAIAHRGGHRVDLSVVIVPVMVDGQVVGNHIIAKDITEEKRAKEQIRHLAFHDELTGLPNRRMFNQAISETIEDRRDKPGQFAVMVLDIDRFKMINDSLGHTYGDLFLKEVSGRIRQSAEGFDVTVARLGGDEFTLLCHGRYDGDETSVLAERIIRTIQLPYRLKDNDFYVTASIGIAVFPEHGRDAVDLLKNADTAMYEVKKQGKNGFRFFSPELDAQLLEKIELEGDLRKAVERGELVLYYQPQFRAGDQQLVGVEALTRWKHPTRGLLSPGVFIPIAEETGMIYELGTWVMLEACRQMREWQAAGGPLIPVSVNLSTQQFHQPNLAGYIRRILGESGLEAQYLELEITESMMMDADVSTGTLHDLNEIGVRISLDDFGTGYSSLNYLKLFPIHKLKIDRSFIRDITFNDDDKAIVSTIISMAQHLNMEVIAEGIETKEQLDILLDKNCKEIQGYYFSKPLPADEVRASFFMQHRHAN